MVWSVGLGVIFTAGVVSGAAGYAYWHHSYLLWVHDHPDDIPDIVLQKLTSKLSLTEEQIPKVAELIRRNHEQLERLQDEIRPRVDQRCTAYEAEMKALLTEEQYAIWLPHFRDVCRIWLP
ncbi:hypothetical protein GC163_23640 [bacterium]|nr:hypothetical protein [bacterium]